MKKITSTEAANILGISPAVLANWRYNCKGPEYEYVKTRVYYDLRDVIKWKKDHL